MKREIGPAGIGVDFHGKRSIIRPFGTLSVDLRSVDEISQKEARKLSRGWGT